MDTVGNVPVYFLDGERLLGMGKKLLWRSDKLVVKFNSFLIYLSLWECHRVAHRGR